MDEKGFTSVVSLDTSMEVKRDKEKTWVNNMTAKVAPRLFLPKPTDLEPEH